MRALLIALLGLLIAGSAYAAVHKGGADSGDQAILDKTPAEWLACSTGRDCALVQYGCDGTIAANTAHQADVQKLAYSISGNPAEIKCAVTPPNHYVASCLSSRCVATNPLE